MIISIVVIIIIILPRTIIIVAMSLVELADHILAHTAVGVGVRDAQIVVDVLHPKLWGGFP